MRIGEGRVNGQISVGLRWIVLTLDAHIRRKPPDISIADHKRILLKVGSSGHYSKILSNPPKLLNVLQPRIIVVFLLAGAVTLLAVEANDSSDYLDEVSPLEGEVVFLEGVYADAFGSAD